MKRVGLSESHDIAIQEYIANLKALVPKDEVFGNNRQDTLSIHLDQSSNPDNCRYTIRHYTQIEVTGEDAYINLSDLFLEAIFMMFINYYYY